MFDRKYLQQFFNQLDKQSSGDDSFVEKMPAGFSSIDSLIDGYPWVNIVGYATLILRDIESESESGEEESDA